MNEKDNSKFFPVKIHVCKWILHNEILAFAWSCAICVNSEFKFNQFTTQFKNWVKCGTWILFFWIKMKINLISYAFYKRKLLSVLYIFAVFLQKQMCLFEMKENIVSPCFFSCSFTSLWTFDCFNLNEIVKQN